MRKATLGEKEIFTVNSEITRREYRWHHTCCMESGSQKAFSEKWDNQNPDGKKSVT